jgi:hypothetical protein
MREMQKNRRNPRKMREKSAKSGTKRQKRKKKKKKRFSHVPTLKNNAKRHRGASFLYEAHNHMALPYMVR